MNQIIIQHMLLIIRPGLLLATDRNDLGVSSDPFCHRLRLMLPSELSDGDNHFRCVHNFQHVLIKSSDATKDMSLMYACMWTTWYTFPYVANTEPINDRLFSNLFLCSTSCFMFEHEDNDTTLWMHRLSFLFLWSPLRLRHQCTSHTV